MTENIPPGYRFEPTDSQLIISYLTTRINNEPLPCKLVREINAYGSSPDDLAEKLKFRHGREEKMYVISKRQQKYTKGKRPSRIAGDGSWRQSNTSMVYDKNNVHVGFMTRLEYLKNNGKPGKGIKTKWLMQEYTVIHPDQNNKWNNDLVLCKIYESPRQTKKRGAEPGAGDSQPDVIEEDIGDSQLNMIRRISYEPSLTESLDERSSKIRRVSSDQPLSSYPSQHIASSFMEPGVASIDGINSLPNQDDDIQYIQSSTLDQKREMPGSQQERICQVPSNGEVDRDNHYREWKNLLEDFDDYLQIDSSVQYDQSPIPLEIQMLDYQQEQFNQILSNGEADGINNLTSQDDGIQHIQSSQQEQSCQVSMDGEEDLEDLLKMINIPSNFDDNIQFDDSFFQLDQSSTPQGMQAFGYQQEQLNQIRVDSWDFGTNNMLHGGLQCNQNSSTLETQMCGFQQQPQKFTDWLNSLNMTYMKQHIYNKGKPIDVQTLL